MRKRVRIALAVAVAAMLAVLGWEVLRPGIPNPIVDGKPLMSWLDSYVPRQSKPADRALDKVGTNAIPMLLWMLRQKDSSFKRKVMDVVQKQKFIKVNYVRAEERNYAASFAFQKLGVRAEVAVPALIEIYKLKLSPSSQAAAARSLGSIGPGATSAIPVLVRGMANTNFEVRLNNLRALAYLHIEPELVVPVFTNGLNDPNIIVRRLGCIGLRVFGGEAKQAVPALLKALHDSDPDVRNEAAMALRQIDPEAAAKAGVESGR